MESLEIQPRYSVPYMPSMDVDKYEWHLQKSWTSYSPNSTWFLRQYKPEINKDTKSKLLDLIRAELDSFIYENRILPGYFFMLCINGHEYGVELNDLLDKLLKISIFGGIDRTVSDLASSITQDAFTSFESIVLLEGITLEEEIQIFEGIRLVPVPASSELPRCLGSLTGISETHLHWRTMLVIDYSISPIFQKPSIAAIEDKRHNHTRTVLREKLPMDSNGFRIKTKGEKSPEYTSTANRVFHQKFCQALSLVCNSGVKPAMGWEFLAEDELLNINPENLRVGSHLNPGPFGDRIMVSVDRINKAKCLYETLVNLTSNLEEYLHIPIDRWIQSKAGENPIDKIIDLAIAFESIYLTDRDGNSELSFQFRLRASWFLGKDVLHRQELMKDFRKIYEWRSKVVHTGKIPNKTKKTPFTQEDINEFIKNAQDLCRDSIMKIVEDGKFPDWSNLILGEESS